MLLLGASLAEPCAPLQCCPLHSVLSRINDSDWLLGHLAGRLHKLQLALVPSYVQNVPRELQQDGGLMQEHKQKMWAVSKKDHTRVLPFP